MASHHSAGEAIQLRTVAGRRIGIRPAVPPRSRTDDQSRVRHAPRDDNVGAGSQRCGDGLAAEVGVGGEELHAVGSFARVEVDPRLVEFAHTWHEVIAGDDADAHRADVELRDDLGERIGATLGV